MRIKSDVGVKVMLMVKADAYGHGLCEVAKAVEDIVDAFGVATLEEGLELRRIGISKEILVLALAPNELYRAIDNGLTVGLANGVQLDMLEQLISADIVSAEDIKLHIAIDSGMHRLGFGEKQINMVTRKLKQLDVTVGGIYSHLRVRSYKQVYAFERACAAISKAYTHATRHLAASKAAVVSRLRYDMVRVGISAYDGAMSVESKVIATRRVEKDENVSYGRYKLKKATNTAVVFGGYADGVSRERPSKVYIRGRECKVIGRVCMDMCVVDCGSMRPYIGERVILCDGTNIKDIAKQRMSIDYTVMTCWRGRIERIYTYDESGSEGGG